MTAEPSSALPVADPRTVRTALREDLRTERGAVVTIVSVNALAAMAGLAAPWLLGRIIDTIRDRSGEPVADVLAAVDMLALLAVGFTALQIGLTWSALRLSYRFGERTTARVRERFLTRVLALPPRTAAHVPAGDLIARGQTDATSVGTTLRWAVPAVLVAAAHAVLLITAVLLLNLWLGLLGLATLLGLWLSLRWYLKRSRPVYLEVAAANAELADTIASAAHGARTIDLLSLQTQRNTVTDKAIRRARDTRLDALWLRTVLFPSADISIALPVVAVLLVGGTLYLRDAVSLGVVVTATLYLRQLGGPSTPC